MKQTSTFICQQCGYQSASFLGRCPECGEWNSLVESVDSTSSQLTVNSERLTQNLFKLSDVKFQKVDRVSTGFSEFDRVLGGGVVCGSIILISGDPGIGKSTILLQVAMQLARSVGRLDGRKVGKEENKVNPLSHKPTIPQTHSVLYVTGEESSHQVKIRADRVGKIPENLYILPETNVEVIVAAAQKIAPRLLIVDSV